MTAPRRQIRLVWAVLVLLWTSDVPVLAGFTPIAQPNGPYLGATALLPIPDPAVDPVVMSLTNGDVTVSFLDTDSLLPLAMPVLTVPGTWSTWGSPPNTESATPRVLWTEGFTSVTLALSKPLFLFGLEAEPEVLSVFPITASFYNGALLLGEILRDVDGNGGALLFAAASTDTFDRVVLSSSVGFGIAQVRVGATAPAPVPEPGPIAGLLSLAVMSVVVGRRRFWNSLVGASPPR